ncbi:Kelch domain-containing protein 2 [Willisornis vidua]|uniref:Kelch domain-containing protein 2 n=1 Tax=Willisornis vidua TaxID=1566151 RepID=A0ABQ9DEX5_9PASS|nr:Kelch domain-containing protein 2 [Willisornis vidua]
MGRDTPRISGCSSLAWDTPGMEQPRLLWGNPVMSFMYLWVRSKVLKTFESLIVMISTGLRLVVVTLGELCVCCSTEWFDDFDSKNAQVRGFYDFYLPRDEIWIYNMETGRWKKSRTEGDVPPSMSGSCAVCVDRVVYLFGGHHARGNTNKFYMLNSRCPDKVLQWVRVECQGVPPSSKDKLGVWVYRNKLVFFGGYGYFPEGKQRGTFEFDETSFWGKTPSPRAAHACATVGNRGFVFGGRYRDSRMNDFYYLDLDTWEWNEMWVLKPDLLRFFGVCKEAKIVGDAWIYCISKNEWVQFEHNYPDKPRLCLEAVICFKEMLASSWNCLPKHLLHSVNQRFGSNNTSGS